MGLNFTISELIKSDVANANKINNIPQQAYIYDNLLNLIIFCLQPLREKIGKPIIISSGYRCDKLNKLVGGVSNSGHKDGTCVDISINGMSSGVLFNCIVNSGLKFTQLIDEHSNNKSWVHIDYRKNNLKCEKLKYINGKYKPL